MPLMAVFLFVIGVIVPTGPHCAARSPDGCCIHCFIIAVSFGLDHADDMTGLHEYHGNGKGYRTGD